MIAARRCGACKALLAYEGGEASRLSDETIEIGIAGALAVMAALGMTEARRGPCESSVHAGSQWVRAETSGLLRLDRWVGDMVKAGESIGSVDDVFTDKRTPLVTPIEGLVVGVATDPRVFEGDAVLHVAKT